jgi:PLP dependent protein
MTLLDNYQKIHEKIQRACCRAYRNPADVQIVAATKSVEVTKIREAIDAGIHIIGENRVQEAWVKYQSLGSRIAWHFIGHLQTNKVKRVLQFIETIESVDSFHLAKEIHQRAGEYQKNIKVFIEVNTSGELSKFGIKPEGVPELLYQCAQLNNIQVTGLMTIGSYTNDPAQIRPCFSLLKELLDHINAQKIPNIHLRHLSMGMSNDFEVAVEEGATLVRIGQALFGNR